MKSLKINSYVLFLIPALLVVLLYLPLIGDPTLIHWDDHTLVEQIEKTPFTDYWGQLFNHQLIDAQPIRDLSYFLDFFLEQQTGFSFYHLSQLLFWLTAIFLFIRIATRYAPVLEDRFFLLLMILIFATHPLTTNSVAWISGRKHLLSALFIFWATAEALSLKDSLSLPQAHRKNFKIVVLYLLAVLSQPINLAWPLWYAFTQRQTLKTQSPFRRSTAFTLGGLFIATAVVGWMNWAYYNSEKFLVYSNGRKFLENASALSYLKVYGRFFYQILWPLHPSIQPYQFENPAYFVGLLLALPVLILLFRNTSREQFFTWSLFFALPLLVVTFRLSQQGGWDTYLLTPWLGFSILTLLAVLNLWKRFKTRFSKSQGLLFGVFGGLQLLAVILCLWITVPQIQVYKNERAAYRNIALNDPSDLYQLIFADHLLKNEPKDPARAFQIAQTLKDQNSKELNLPQIWSLALFHRPDVDLYDKIKIFHDNPMNSVWYYYYLAVLEVQLGDKTEPFETMKKILSENTLAQKDSFYGIEQVAGTMKGLCLSKNSETNSECLAIESQFKVHFPRWSSETFENRAQMIYRELRR